VDDLIRGMRSSHRGSPPIRPPLQGGCGGPYLVPRTPSDKAQCAEIPTHILTVLVHSIRAEGISSGQAAKARVTHRIQGVCPLRFAAGVLRKGSALRCAKDREFPSIGIREGMGERRVAELAEGVEGERTRPGGLLAGGVGAGCRPHVPPVGGHEGGREK